MAEEHNIPKVYDPASVEKKWYKYWEEHRYFHAEVEADKKPFSIVIPPPNITGQLIMKLLQSRKKSRSRMTSRNRKLLQVVIRKLVEIRVMQVMVVRLQTVRKTM